MVTVLVSDAGAFDIELDVNAVAVLRGLEELARDGDRCRERILGVVDALGFGQSASRQFTYKHEFCQRLRQTSTGAPNVPW